MSSRKNHDIVGKLWGRVYIPFDSNATGKTRGSRLWKKAFHYFQLHRDEFDEHYHKRSNVESVFNMMKRKFGPHLNSKSETGQINEVLYKALAHNVCVLIQEYHENDIKRNFNYCRKTKVAR